MKYSEQICLLMLQSYENLVLSTSLLRLYFRWLAYLARERICGTMAWAINQIAAVHATHIERSLTEGFGLGTCAMRQPISRQCRLYAIGPRSCGL